MKRSTKLLKSVPAIFLAVTLAAAPVMAGETDIQVAGGYMQQLVSNTDTFLSVRSMDDLLKDSGMSWAERDQKLTLSRQRGIEKQLSEQDIREAAADVKLLKHNDMICTIEGSMPVYIHDQFDAYETAYSLLDILGRPDNPELMQLHEITSGDYISYVYQEVSEGCTVVASTLRLITDADGQLVYVRSSLAEYPSETAGAVIAGIDEVHDAVAAYLEEQGSSQEILPEYTCRILEYRNDDEADEALPADIVWAVYCADDTSESGYPYTAHYVDADGSYQYSQKVRTPQDEAGQSGYDTAYLFEDMQAETWTGEVYYANGQVRTITVPVMRSMSDGIYYLGDKNRRIMIAEFAGMFYDDDIRIPAASDSNAGWENSDLICYENYIRVWDEYAKLGWKGADGCNTPTLLLRNMQTEEGEPMDNAAYCGKYMGWQMFAYDDSESHVGEGLDVWVHEFTHGITNTIQGENRYENDCGAVNESLSDIMGNLCEMIMEQETDSSWDIGEDTASALRSMLYPKRYGQPEYVWDEFYCPHTDSPNDANDRGGVHSNSSILNLLAAKLCVEEGMPLEAARNYWMLVINAVTPETDLPQMADVLTWAMDASGLTEYQEALQELISQVQLTRTAIPDTLEEGKKLVTLTLPDTEAMADRCWILDAVQLDGDAVSTLISTALKILFSGNDPDSEGSFEDELINSLTGIIGNHISYVSDDELTMNMVISDQPAIYTLMNLDVDTYDLRRMLVLAGNQWISLDVENLEMQYETPDDIMVEKALEALVENGIDMLINLIAGMDEKKSEGSDIIILPTNGLETVTLPQPE